jgi:hypothetical protein
MTIKNQENDIFNNENLKVAMKECYTQLAELYDNWQEKTEEIDETIAGLDFDDNDLAAQREKIYFLTQDILHFMTPLIDFDEIVHATLPKLKNFVSVDRIEPIKKIVIAAITGYEALTEAIKNANVNLDSNIAKTAFVNVYEKLQAFAEQLKNLPDTKLENLQKLTLFADSIKAIKPLGREIANYISKPNPLNTYNDYKHDLESQARDTSAPRKG